MYSVTSATTKPHDFFFGAIGLFLGLGFGGRDSVVDVPSLESLIFQTASS